MTVPMKAAFCTRPYVLEASTNLIVMLALASNAHHTVAEHGDIHLKRNSDCPVVHNQTHERGERDALLSCFETTSQRYTGERRVTDNRQQTILSGLGAVISGFHES